MEWLAGRKDTESTKIELLYLTKLLEKRARLLDLACGYGRFSIPLAMEGYEVYGIDITPSFIDDARKNALKNKINIDFRVGDMRSIPYADGMFQNVICMWNAFSEIVVPEDQEKCLFEIYRVLAVGGGAILENRNHRTAEPVMDNNIDGIEARPTFNHTQGSRKNFWNELE